MLRQPQEPRQCVELLPRAIHLFTDYHDCTSARCSSCASSSHRARRGAHPAREYPQRLKLRVPGREQVKIDLVHGPSCPMSAQKAASPLQKTLGGAGAGVGPKCVLPCPFVQAPAHASFLPIEAPLAETDLRPWRPSDQRPRRPRMLCARRVSVCSLCLGTRGSLLTQKLFLHH